ncbi:MAG TPA: tRNA (adenosine(37)-N6)-threonylcarbamoyltransferase complex dimerization subunit type 1 TsaB [Bacteroidales bacterium]|nr:tRNA (adenosine(37)-N6)-threonylcarbamoyltransferase complex dimerization subunit type 1 TsaB [Bacteroidales bacterium]
MILAIETATRICSVALFDATGVKGVLESAEENAHSRILNVLIDRLMKDLGMELKELSAVAVSKGPGSYTGLRIGVSAAKGLCYAKDLPLIAVNTLESMAFGLREVVESYLKGGFPIAGMKQGVKIVNSKGEPLPAGEDSAGQSILYVPMIDARRMEVYSAIFDQNTNIIRETEAEIIAADSFSNYKDRKLILGGDGAGKCKGILSGDNIYFLPETFNTSARFMQYAALKALEEKHFEDTAYFEPYYLKDFIAGKPKVKGLE